MLDIIAKLIDFDPQIFSPSQIIEDFSHKFAGSWVSIDDDFYKVLSLYEDDDSTYKLKVSNLDGDNQYLNIKHIRKITPFLPPTGLYKSVHGVAYLSRLPARQWLKSFADNKNYKCTTLATTAGIPNARNTILSPEAQFHQETMLDHAGCVWLHWRNVGKLDGRKNTIYLNDDTFLKEITELWPQYQITSAAKPQPVLLDERLITDF